MPVGEVAASQLTLQMVPDYPPGPTALTGVPECGGGRVGGQAAEPEPSLDWSLLAGKTEAGQEPRKMGTCRSWKSQENRWPPQASGGGPPADTRISVRGDRSVSNL